MGIKIERGSKIIWCGATHNIEIVERGAAAGPWIPENMDAEDWLKDTREKQLRGGKQGR